MVKAVGCMASIVSGDALDPAAWEPALITRNRFGWLDGPDRLVAKIRSVVLPHPVNGTPDLGGQGVARR